MIKKLLNKYNHDAGILALRLGFGGMYAVYYGSNMIFGGPKLWAQIGSAMSNVGINFAPTFFGFLASSSEFVGGIFIMLGLLFRPAAAAMLITMLIAVTMHFSMGQGMAVASHAIDNGIVLIALMIIGPGKYSLDGLLFGKSRN